MKALIDILKRFLKLEMKGEIYILQIQWRNLYATVVQNRDGGTISSFSDVNNVIKYLSKDTLGGHYEIMIGWVILE